MRAIIFQNRIYTFGILNAGTSWLSTGCHRNCLQWHVVLNRGNVNIYIRWSLPARLIFEIPVQFVYIRAMDSKLGTFFAVVCWLVALCLADVLVPDCNRSCLETVVSKYLAALTAHNSSPIPTTPSVRYVENDQVIPLGTGLWPIASSPGKYKHISADSEFGQVAAITAIKENNIPAIYVFRLKVEADRNISEI